MSSFIPRTLLLSALVVPAAAASLAIYLYDHPLPASRSHTIRESNTLSPSTSKSPTIKRINPRNHQALVDSRTISLPQIDIKDLSDEEILARFTKGFFNGWIIAPERFLVGVVELLGSTVLPVGFTGIENKRPIIAAFTKLSRSSLPSKHTPFYGGNFMVVESHLNTKDVDPMGSFVEIAFGDDRQGFAGVNRFEVSRLAADQGVIVSYSSLACNPKDDRPIFSWADIDLVARFHRLYALYLFRDGIREVLSG